MERRSITLKSRHSINTIRTSLSINSKHRKVYQNYVYHQYDETKSHYSEYKLMIITSLIFTLTSFISIGDSYLFMFYTNNTNNYSFNLAYENGYQISPFYSRIDYNITNDLNLRTKIKKKDKNIKDYMIYNYVKFYNQNKGKESHRLFIFYFFFSLGELLCGGIAYFMRKPTKNWRLDTLISEIFEALGNFSLIGIIILWIYIEFSKEMDYFLFLRCHFIFHYLSIALNSISFGFKIYWCYIMYTTDYFENIKYCESKKFF